MATCDYITTVEEPIHLDLEECQILESHMTLIDGLQFSILYSRLDHHVSETKFEFLCKSHRIKNDGLKMLYMVLIGIMQYRKAKDV